MIIYIYIYICPLCTSKSEYCIVHKKWTLHIFEKIGDWTQPGMLIKLDHPTIRLCARLSPKPYGSSITP